MPKPDSKDYILQKTFYLLLTKGYDGVSITDIQRETGMSRGLLYHYYGGKEELFREAAKRFLVGTFLTNRDDTKGYNLTDMISHIIREYTNLSEEWKRYAGAGTISIADYDFLFYQMVRKEKSIAAMYNRMRQEEKTAWTEAVQISMDRGEITSVLDAEKIAAHLILLLDGGWTQSAGTGTISQYIRMAKQALKDYYELIKT